MSLLDFLKVAAGNGRPKQRKLAIEALEQRAVMTTLNPLLANLSEPVQPPIQTAAAVLSTAETLAQPIANNPLTGPITQPLCEDPPPPLDPLPPPDPPPPDPPPDELPPPDPPPDDPPPDELPPPDPPTDPEITDAQYTREGDWVNLSGTVADDGPLAGMVVYCTTDMGQSFQLTVNADGTFLSHSLPIDVGVQVTLWTIDADGNQSESWMLIV
jgi:hypothetical protein